MAGFSPAPPRPGSGTAPAGIAAAGAAMACAMPPGAAGAEGLRAPGGRPAGGFVAAAGFTPLCPGSGTADCAAAGFAAPSALARCTVNGFLQRGHLMESPVGGTRESSSS